MLSVNITQAKAQLSALIREIEENDAEIIIEKAGKPLVRMVKFKKEKKINRIDIFKGKIKIADDFDHLPDDIADAFGMN